MRVKDYEKVTSLEANDILLIDGDRGVKTIAPKVVHESLLDGMTSDEYWKRLDEFCSKAVYPYGRAPGLLRRKIFRGANIGTSFTDKHKESIRNYTFDNMFIGDYFTINGHTWRIWDFIYWLGKGDTSCTTPHILVGPDSNLYSHAMNDTHTTEGGYRNSKMVSGGGLVQAKEMLDADFGSAHILIHRELLTNAVSNGRPSSGEWIDSDIILMNEFMVYGHSVFLPTSDGTTIPYNYTIDTDQLAIFQLWPEYQNFARSWYWLRDVVSAANFARVGGTGYADCRGAADSGGVRPVCGITG